MNVLIVEDEPLIAQRLMREVRNFFGERLRTLTHRDEVEEALDTLRAGAVDLLLLDLNLHADDGYRLLQLASVGKFRTIIVSAHAERAVRAFDFGVLDFVAKPFGQARLHQAFQRFAGHMEEGRPHSLLVKKTGSIELLPFDRINHIRAYGHYTQVRMCDGSEHFHDSAIDKLMDILPPHFLRVHRSYAVNMQHVARLRIEAGGKYQLDTHYAADIPVSRLLYPMVRVALAGAHLP